MARKSRRNVKDCIVTTEKKWSCGGYYRLSDDDHTGYESNSIENQRELIQKHIKESTDLLFVSEYIDDGRSGTTFHRPGFGKMMEDLKSGKVNCVIVKDLSRFGRNYIDVEDYIMKVFPFLKVRFIAVNDSFDTLNMESDEKLLEVKIKNLANDFYAKQVSLNVGTAFEDMGKRGIYHGPIPPYGFLIDNSDKQKRHLILEDGYADTAKMIYTRFVSGESIYKITKYLNENKIVPPLRHFTDLGLYRAKIHEKETIWHKSTVKAILINPAYCGCLAVNRSKRSLYQNISWHKIPKEEWKLIEHTHEGIVSRDIYDKVQRILAEKKKVQEEYAKETAGSKKENVFAGKMQCGHCEGKLKRDYFWTADKKRRSFFQHCTGYSYKTTKTGCKNCYINENHLERVILKMVSQYIEVLADRWQILNSLTDSKSYQNHINHLKQELNNNIASQKKLINKKQTLYLNFKSGILSEEEYLYAKSSYSEENLLRKNKIDAGTKKIEELEQKLSNTKQWVTIFNKYKNITHLTRELMEELILNISIYSSDRVKIIFRFRDDFMELEEYLNEWGYYQGD